MVSTLFQQLAFLRSNHLIPWRFRSKLPDLDLSIIEFLYLMEEKGINVRAEVPKPIAKEEEHLKPMYAMYNDWIRAREKNKVKK